MEKDKNKKILVERKNYSSEESYQQALRLEKRLDEMEIRVDIKKRTCFECKELVKKETDLKFYPQLDNKWVKVCQKCRKKFSDFGVKQINTNEKCTNWYEAEKQSQLNNTDKRIKHMMVIFNDFSEEGTEREMLRAGTGNIQAKLNLIMHNQAILNEKLNHPMQTIKERSRDEAEECSRCNQKLRDVTIRRIENVESHNDKLCGKWCDECFEWLGGIIK